MLSSKCNISAVINKKNKQNLCFVACRVDAQKGLWLHFL